MLPLGEPHEEDNLECRWGRKKSVGVRNKDVQFYTSFTNDGVEYFLYDCVYLWRHNELDIGKIVSLCESASHEKVAKVVWFFRPIEIRQWPGDVEPLWNEVFLASGEGKGLCNVNPLEAICGKCNVVCTSKDKRNPQATKEELKMTDYIFCRTFDVARCTISPIFADVIAGTEVKHFFNREKDQKFTASEVGANLNGKIANPSLFVKDKGSKFDNQFLDVTRRPVEGVTVLRPEKDGKFDTSPKPAAKDKAEMKRVQDLSTTSLFDSESPKRRELRLSDVGPEEDRVKLSDALRRVPDAPDSAIKNLKHYAGIRGKVLNPVTERIKKQEKSGEKGSPASITWVLQKASRGQATANHGVPAIGSGSGKDKDSKSNNQILEVTRRPAAETSKWFEQQPWDEKIKSANDRGTLVLLENLDPSYTSSEVQDIIWSAFNVTGEAKIIPRCALSSPHHEDAADHAISELKGKCLMLPNGRPLVGRKGCPVEPKNSTRFVGHLVIEKLKFRKQNKDWKIAVSTSHYSQPNTIEYDMAVEWLVLQEKSKLQWDALNKQHAKEIERLRSQLKTHRVKIDTLVLETFTGEKKERLRNVF